MSNRRKARGADRALMVLAAARYADANKSDPFAMARAMTHINNGIAEYATGRDATPGYYDAEEGVETRMLPDGTAYQATIYKNVARV